MHEPPRILIVDDEPFNVAVLEQELEDLGYDTVSAVDGLDALRQVATHAPDVVLLDLMMPHLDGFGVLAQLRRDPATRDLPVIVISAAHDLAHVVRATELGAADHLPKPFEPVLLRARLETTLERKRRRDRDVRDLQDVQRLADAARALEDGTLRDPDLAGVAARPDALGLLARVFTQMALAVGIRESGLRRQLRELERDLQLQREAAADHVTAYVPMDRRHALASGVPLPALTRGAALHADVSGFTALGDTLARRLGAHRGAEELVGALNRLLDRLVAGVHRQGGSVVTFSGDALTCWFDGDAGLRALACAADLQRAVTAFNLGEDALPGRPPIALRIAVAAGDAHRRLVGDAATQHFEVLDGPAPTRAITGEPLGQGGEVLVHEDLARSLALRVTAWRTAPGGDRYGAVTGPPHNVPDHPWPALPEHQPTAAQARPWLPPVAYAQIVAGHSAFLAELCDAVALFLGFTAMSGDSDLDAFVRWVQGTVARHGGTLLQCTVQGTGGYVYAVFGLIPAPQGSARGAAEAALRLAAPPPDVTGRWRVQAGLAAGPLRAGAYGGAAQRTYGAQGDTANLAARLMQRADGTVLCDAALRRRLGPAYAFGPERGVTVKGKAAPEPASVLRGSRAAARSTERLARLPAAQQDVLKVASVLDAPFSLALLTAVHPRPPGDRDLTALLGTLVRRRLLTRYPDQHFTLADPAVRDVIGERLLASQRRLLHRRAAEWYEARGHPPDLATLARHWQHAGEPERAAEYLELRAQQEAQAGHAAAAVADLTTAVALHTRSPGTDGP